MISRHGGSRGRATAQHVSSSLDPLEEVQVYPTTRSGRGRGHGRGRGEAC